MSYNNTIINITRQEDAWNYFTPNENEVYRINKFDDGNSNLINYINMIEITLYFSLLISFFFEVF